MISDYFVFEFRDTIVNYHTCMYEMCLDICCKLFFNPCSLDRRSKTRIGHPTLIHKKGSKVTSLHCNPAQPEVLLSGGNDHYVSVLCINTYSPFLIYILIVPHLCDY